MEWNPTFRDSQQAVDNAIAAHVLSENPTAVNFAGLYMYMHTERDGAGLEIDAFKHIDTRRYIRVPFPYRAVA